MDKIGITLHVFSGMPDPAWEIDEHHPHHKAIMSKIADSDGSKEPEAPFDGLGYKGFSVKAKNKTLRIHRQSDKEIEHLLIRTRKPSASANACTSTETHVVDPVFAHVVESIGKLDLDRPHLPAYEPDKWSIPSVQPHNNCYNYANNMMTNTFAQPGRASGYSLQHGYTGKEVEKYAEADGLKACKGMRDCPGNLVALVFWPPSQDFHWYRKDDNEMFSHKPGQTKVRNYDNSGKKISNPEKCDRGPYTEFVSFMATFPKSTHIK